MSAKRLYTRCYRCGETLGMGSSVIYALDPSQASALDRLRFSGYYLKEMLREMAMRWGDGHQDYCQRCRKRSDWKDDLPFSERRPAGEDASGFDVLPSLLINTTSDVYGLKGNPLGLRLSDLDLSMNSPGQVNLRYTAGGSDGPQRALDLYQDTVSTQYSPQDRLLTELQAIISLVLICASTEQKESYESRGNVHRRWNLDYVSRATRRNATIQIDGKPTEVSLAHWEGSEETALARLALGGLPVMAVSLGITRVRLLGLLKGLVALRQDSDALAEHDRDYRASRPTSA